MRQWKWEVYLVTHSAKEHYRQIFNRRTPGEVRTLAHIKRFLECFLGDAGFRSALSENLDNPRSVAARYGIEVDPMEMLPLWHSNSLKYDRKPEGASWPLALAWREYIGEMVRNRDLLRDEGNMSVAAPRFHAWRERQMRRCEDVLGGCSKSITHPVIAFELSDGCTGGCWFCGLSAGRFKDYFEYSKENTDLWRGVVGAAREMFGSAASTGFCYCATDPMDNPDYDRFLFDYYQITGTLPQTTTAMPLKDLALTKRVLQLFERYRCVTNRFSVLSTAQLNQIHATFSPEELMGVELVLQGKEMRSSKAFAGRARKEKLSAVKNGDATVESESDHSTIACVSGFLVNMPRRRVQLVTPVPASGRWPLGYRIVDERFFGTPDEFRDEVQSMIDEHMHESPPANRPIRFRGDLQYEAKRHHFLLRSCHIEYQVHDNAASSVGDLIAGGRCTASELVAQVVTDGASAIAVADELDQLHMRGLLEEDLDERFAWRNGKGKT
ncbi:radical SAM family RiPP maturation amino acid epimerase [Rhizobium leguminosarum]|uniref:radical SAM family RiPP maturation amino acid epimerase n=1 Tax=Rhizobium leguminosarum TaxID=384 RepID=UPI001C909DE6|nr:radical SAM family RiPP maturation amino acid epimerase [Rhizobium leguminosarum]MBY2925995.1 radical SAM family RiPP maturation amino acid epimerase [Rhizobium leguminosarum]MBY2937981.1 radical SAM family RiPP maturation amino acid epimerase [Rhizobium leguminosarum]